MLTYHEKNDVVVIELDYDLAENTIIKFSEDMTSLLDKGKNRFVIDLKRVSFMTSMGLGSLCEINKKLEPRSGWIRLINVNDQLRDFFSFTMLTDIFKIYDSVDDAVTKEK